MQTESSTDQATAPPPSVPGGTVSAVRGSVLDVVFAQGATPAINDALRTAGVTQFDMPATPPRVWTALQGARQARPA